MADNKTAELADWDYELLPIELDELQATNFDLELLGFDQDELANLLDPGVQQGLTDPDDIPEPPDEPITQPGDLWILGEHRLLCGDSANADDVDRLLDGADIHLCNTDPPYNVKVEPRSNNAIAAGLSSFQGTHQSGHRVLIVTTRTESHELADWWRVHEPDRVIISEFLTRYQLPVEGVVFTSHQPKVGSLVRHGIDLHYDNDANEAALAAESNVRIVLLNGVCLDV